MTALLRLAIRASYYPSLAFNRLMCGLGVWNLWNWIDDWVLLGAMPIRRNFIDLQSMNVGGVVNLCDEPCYAASLPQRYRIELLCLPTMDYHCPTVEQLVEGLRFIERMRVLGKKCYLHCKAGRGRSATLALCYLMQTRHLRASEALAALAAARPHLAHGLDRRPAVLEIERMIQRGELEVTATQSAASSPT